jgi:subtilisin family serine protease
MVMLRTTCLAQDVLTESAYSMDHGVLMCRRVIVSFNRNVIDAQIGTEIIDTRETPIQDEDVGKLIDNLAALYGTPTIRKTMPHLVWGDTIVINRRTGQPTSVPDMSQEFAFDFPQHIPLFETIEQFNALSAVKYAEPPIQIRLTITPNDPLYLAGLQWHLYKINSASAWNITTGSSSIKIAIIDEGGGLNLEGITDLAGRITGGDGLLSGAHFVYVSGVAGARTNNERGIASLGWNTSMFGYHFSVNTESGTRLPTWIERAKDSVDVINFSFVTIGPHGNSLAFCPRHYQSVANAIASAHAAGVVLVASMGNDNPTCGGVPFDAHPAAYAGVIAVSGTNGDDEFANSTWNYGDYVDVCGLAVAIRTTDFIDEVYNDVAGTSFSAPLVSALAGLILSIDPSFTTDQVEQFIEQSAEDLGPTGRDDHFGYGRINAYKALSMANGRPNTPSLTLNIVYEQGIGYPHLAFSSSSPDVEKYEIWRQLTGTGLPGTNVKIGEATSPSYTDYSLSMVGSGQYTATYTVEAVDAVNLVSDPSSPASVHYGDAYKLVVMDPGKPTELALHQNHPNPCNPVTQIRFDLPSEGLVQLRVFDVVGREVALLVNEVKPTGHFTVNFDPTNLASGLYVYRLQHNGKALTKSMLVLK